MGITKFVLKRPVTVIMTLLCLLVFGISSVFSATLEEMPDTDQPMMIVVASYSGAGPEDICELVTEPIEDSVSALEGIKSMSSTSSDDSAQIMLEYDYGTDMDDAYDDLNKKLDSLKDELPDDVSLSIMEMNNNAGTTMMLSVANDSEKDLYDYVDQTIVPEFEKISSIAEVEASGGASKYIKIELQSDKMEQYQVTMDEIKTAMASADLTQPSGEAVAGNLKLSVSTAMEYNTLDALKEVPITSSKGEIVYLEDIANVYEAEEEKESISRYDGQDTISLSITKQQSSTAMEVSEAVTQKIKSMEAADNNLKITVINDSADSILSSLKDVAETMILAVIISMIIIFVFFGDYKASLIVGSSIPTSILLSLIIMTRAGFSLNVITMSALVLGVGMMVDNSIVVLESCFRVTDQIGQKGLLEYAKAALEGTNIVLQSIIGSTVTTCVVFLPLAFLEGMTGQMFKPMGFTIVFCMTASLLSAMTVVPLSYMMYKPGEKEKAPMSRPVVHLQNLYRLVMPRLLKHKALVMLVSAGFIVITFILARGMKTELMPADDTGKISVTIDTRPGLLTEQADSILSSAEAIIAANENVEDYVLRYSNDSGTITAYLKDDRNMDTDDIVSLWKTEMADLDNCTITVEASTSMSFMGNTNGYEVILHGSNYDDLKEVNDTIVKEMTDRSDVINIQSSIENTAPIVTIKVNPVMAAAEGFTPSEVGTDVKEILDGLEVTTLDIDGREVSVMAKYPEDQYKTVEQLKGVILTNSSGSYTALADVADIYFKDSPSSISKQDKEYEITITADYTGENVKNLIDSEVVSPNLTGTITTGVNSRNQMMQEEFSSLYGAIAVAVFMVFVVMSAQFESPKFSFMVMTTIPFSLVGAFGLLKLTGVSISMTSLLGFLILIGTVVNNGILYVDTVNQYRMTMDLQTALIEAGATRLRPILMTSMTTILSMIPMALAIGSSGSTTQGLAIVNIGGLTAGVLVALFILPIYYAVMNGNRKREILDL